MSTVTNIGSLVVFQDRSTKIWIVRDNDTRREIAHESRKVDAIAVAERKNKPWKGLADSLLDFS